MGQISFKGQTPKYCNLSAIQTGGSKASVVPASGEVWLVDTSNGKSGNGAGHYDAYIVGDNSKTCAQLASTALQYLSPTQLSELTADATHRLVTDTEKSTWNGKQSALTFDSTPTSGSSNPVTSGGVYTALQNVDIDVDSALSGSSENPVQNKVVKTALDAKADQSTTYTKTEVDTAMSTKAAVAALAGYTPTANFATVNGASITGGGNVVITAGSSSITTIDATPTSASQNPVQSGGVYSAIEGGFYY